MVSRRQQLGAEGEARVARHYEARGYSVLDRNWRCRDGELDLVLRHGRTLVVCEVKTRSSAAFGTPAEAVTGKKQAKLRLLARRYLETAPFRPGRSASTSLPSSPARSRSSRTPSDQRTRPGRRRARCSQQPLCQWRRRSGARRGTATRWKVRGGMSWLQPGQM